MRAGVAEQNAKVDLRGKALRSALHRIFQKVLSNDPAHAVAFSLSELFQMREDALHQHGFEDIYKCGVPLWYLGCRALTSGLLVPEGTLA